MQPVHIFTPKVGKSFNLIFLLIPSLIFFLILILLGFYIRHRGTPNVARSAQTTVLGEESGLDKDDFYFQNNNQ